MKISASNKNDILSLGQFLKNYPDKPKLVEVLIHLELMKFTDPTMNKIMEIVNADENARSINLEAFNLLNIMDSNILTIFVDETIHWCINGNDTVDNDSIGGWSQAEIDKLLAELN